MQALETSVNQVEVTLDGPGRPFKATATRQQNGLGQRQVLVPYSALPLDLRESGIVPRYAEVPAETDTSACLELYNSPDERHNGIVYTRAADASKTEHPDPENIGSGVPQDERDENNLVVLTED